jgi:hypothetical protein
MRIGLLAVALASVCWLLPSPAAADRQDEHCRDAKGQHGEGHATIQVKGDQDPPAPPPVPPNALVPRFGPPTAAERSPGGKPGRRPPWPPPFVPPGPSTLDLDVDHLRIVVRWDPAVWLGHTQILRIYSPDGGLYQQFSSTIPAARQNETRVPVASTWITEYNLVGTWCVAVYLDGDKFASGRQTFTLTPKHP